MRACTFPQRDRKWLLEACGLLAAIRLCWRRQLFWPVVVCRCRCSSVLAQVVVGSKGRAVALMH